MPDPTTELIERLLAAGDELAARLHTASTEPPKPAPCIAHRRTDGQHDCPNCLALYEWEQAMREASNYV